MALVETVQRVRIVSDEKYPRRHIHVLDAETGERIENCYHVTFTYDLREQDVDTYPTATLNHTFSVPAVVDVEAQARLRPVMWCDHCAKARPIPDEYQNADCVKPDWLAEGATA